MNLRRLFPALACALLCAPAWSQSVALTGIMGERALIVIDGGAPQVLAAGESRQGVTLISAGGDSAVVEMLGQRWTVHVGESPVRVSAPGGSGGAGRLVLSAGSGGHFYTTGQINGVTVQFVVDTGASNVVLGAAQADEIGLKYRDGRPVQVRTANGITSAIDVRLDTVRIGDVEVYNVAATVVPQGSPVVLLGNSVLQRFQMRQENGQLVLEKRY